MSRSQGRIQVPDDLREVLLEFTISYLLEQPGDVVNYAADYFSRLRETRTTQIVFDQAGTTASSPDESTLSREEEPPVGRFSGRRKSVFAEAYDPEEDEDDGGKVVFPKSDEQRQRLAEAVRNILLFRALDKEQMQEVLDAMFERVVKEGELVIKQGDDGDNFYVIQNGIFHALVGEPGGEQKHIHTYENSGSFGELALLYNMPRAATIKAQTDGSLWAMDRQTFRRILLKSAFKKRKMYETLIESVPMLKTLQPYERMNLADALVPKTYQSGDRIIKQGDAADGMYFVEDGTVIISVLDDSGKEVEINRLGKGGYFGELALVTHRPRAASAYAEGDVKLAFLDVEAFERLLGPCMQLMKRNITDYEEQMLKIFGSKHNIRDIR
ncbi:cAMP-dependent protein kinase type II regulatory subunit isoform X1 [Tribolium castaneum]|uniref:cAMP-dependent protein kinase type II regulatory subunit n=1 Tax=Tribolium castaneum TaxID=7070 RepID=D6WSE3_TRICA|nr:PREDICTED: cAMP-dependent protein kinase type II regulatory subunit isoform X1 [Tribolium castaneum]XP_015836944.1 PREDICTED: cAMP-dependent protein kinase type II regulatory subunit isoform X1 [Tribolium castaneum]XP_015836945.1 PREDICTED: cAMP-dependent protein kinase type II regulatory subunit isoform X1 [Tribolium castaneum]EFA06381.2 cAMP-dependent protein kinase type II regulatory subunit-like Protein [Tribolium castaneum]|eukprot:XP_015836942.1 PREDICTED: cAMP-dependent protein kinase type II regulatory subunit isoform X1 [Tribolium castaneum]